MAVAKAKRKVAAKRMTKEELREDKVVTAAHQLTEYVQANMTYVIGAAAVVIIVIVGVMFFTQSRARAEQNASLGMFQAQSLYYTGNYAGALAQFQSVDGQFGGASATKMAPLFIGNCQLALGNPTEAEASFKELLDSAGSDGLVRSAALRGLGSAALDGGNATGAAAHFEDAALTQGNLQAADDWMSAAVAFDQAGAFADARRAYQTVVDQFAASQRAQEARVRLEEMKAK